MKGLLALAVIAAFASALIGSWAFSRVTEQAGAAPPCPPNSPNPPSKCSTPTPSASPTASATPTPAPTPIPGLPNIVVTIADTFDPIEAGLPVTYEVIARNIGDVTGDAIVTFTAGEGFTHLNFDAVNYGSCGSGGGSGGAECTKTGLEPGQWMAMIETGVYAASADTVVTATAVDTINDFDGDPSDNTATETTQVLVP
jgi:hypothetical protein